ncbi:MAG: hypothetical protein IKO53_03560 [Lachnospiraceae bacterium]|nr:hypothetical protein [Lachnospiraceae bacterium]
MKNRVLITLLATGVCAALCTGCNSGEVSVDVPADGEVATEETEDPEGNFGMANPWRDGITDAEAATYAPALLTLPAEAEDVLWRVMDEGGAIQPGDKPGALVEAQFTMEDISYSFRAQLGTTDDISGLYYEWTVEDDIASPKWQDAGLSGKFYRYAGDGEAVDLITWYDEAAETQYALSAVLNSDGDGFDLQAVADEMIWGGEDAKSDNEVIAGLPAYVYPGSDMIEEAVYRFMVDEYAGNYEACDVSIPYAVFVDTDESDEADIKVYGIFWLTNYDLDENNILLCVSGGSYPGVMHLVKNDDGSYEAVSHEVVADGSDFDDSAKELFGDRYDAFVEAMADDELAEEKRFQIVGDYAHFCGAPIEGYQDYGWDPVYFYQ